MTLRITAASVLIDPKPRLIQSHNQHTGIITVYVYPSKSDSGWKINAGLALFVVLAWVMS